MVFEKSPLKHNIVLSWATQSGLSDTRV